jgi:hypothetical protein
MSLPSGKYHEEGAERRLEPRSPIDDGAHRVKDLCQQILDGQVRGRVVIDVNA